MSKFKKGDHIRVINNEGWPDLPIGWMGTVYREASMSPPWSIPSVVWDKPLPGQTYAGPSEILEKRLELITTLLTDEELAAKYRKGREESLADFDELTKRGYTIAHGGQIFCNFLGTDIQIYKTVIEELPVIEKKVVRKEI